LDADDDKFGLNPRMVRFEISYVPFIHVGVAGDLRIFADLGIKVAASSGQLQSITRRE
jgi:hypothetical protein